jgi:peptidoglycan/xylan/chitin deacetylase (PgdA/CDA1 family)
VSILALALALALAAAFVARFVLARWSDAKVVHSVDIDDRVVALTFDDGPNPPDTNDLLEVLAERNVLATFFVIGRHLEAFPESARAIVEAGHEIGSHSHHHRSMRGHRIAAIEADLKRASAAIKGAVGRRPRVFRAPYMSQGPGLRALLARRGMHSIGVSASGDDWRIFDPDEIEEKVRSAVVPGGIIALHDGHAEAEEPSSQADRSATVRATGQLIASLQREGYRFVTVSELLALASGA